MLAPHHAEDAKLDIAGLAVEQALDAAILVFAEAVLLDEFGGYCRLIGHGHLKSQKGIGAQPLAISKPAPSTFSSSSLAKGASSAPVQAKLKIGLKVL
jgi:hypothetical protein